MTYTNETIMSYVDMLANRRRHNIHNAKSDYDRFDQVCYYVSNNGCDDNDGLTPETAWKTVERACAATNDGPYNLLFERGGIWRGSLSVKGKVTVSAYGNGDKPLFMGSPENGADAKLWQLVGGNVWKYHRNMLDCGTVVFNDGEAWAKKLTPVYKDGKFDFDVLKDMGDDLTVFCAADSVLTEDGAPDTAKAEGALYLRCDKGNPGEVFASIEFLPAVGGFYAGGSDVFMNCVSFKYYGASCITAASGIKSFLSYNNEIEWIGGAIKSYVKCDDGSFKAKRGGCGVEINGDIERNFTDNTYFNQIFDAAIAHVSDAPVLFKKIIYSNNLTENCTFSAKYYIRGEEDGKLFDDFMISCNIFRNAGGWGASEHCSCVAPAHVKTCGCAENPGQKLLFKGNIFDHSAGELIRITAKDAQYLPRMSRNTYVQPEGKLLGAYGVSPAETVVYSEARVDELGDITAEYSGEFYFVD